jgi:hypothetical protein
MAFDINADSYPDYDEWGWDDYWKLPDWQTFYDKLIGKYGADEGSRRWLDAWHRQTWGAHPKTNRFGIADWGIAKNLWDSSKKEFFLPAEFVPPFVQNQGQVVTTIDPLTGLPVNSVSGNQASIEELKKTREEKSKKTTKGILIGGGVVLLGLTIVYFVLRAKNRVQ